jgi:hypothetical protein
VTKSKGEEARNAFWCSVLELWRESVIVQSIITLLSIVTLCLWFLIPLFRGDALDGISVPGELMLVIGTILGYWFKSKSEYQARRIAEEAVGKEIAT